MQIGLKSIVFPALYDQGRNISTIKAILNILLAFTALAPPLYCTLALDFQAIDNFTRSVSAKGT